MLEDGFEHRVLQERLGIASPTLTHIIDGMVAQGLVKRRLSHDDARVRRLYVTPKARALNDRLGELGALFEGHGTSCVTELIGYSGRSPWMSCVSASGAARGR